jgi:glyoxylase-like metal-dependent hydrolase (beta-lactamase superfamily II)
MIPESDELNRSVNSNDFFLSKVIPWNRFWALIVLIVALPGWAAAQVDRLYVIDCGSAHATDQSLWSPGVNSGVPIDFSDNCYLIHHKSEGYILWDTGITDQLVALPSGLNVPALGETWRRSKTLVAALADLGVKPADVRYVALSHVHPDHAGNVDKFPGATLLIQKAEWDYAMKLPQKPFSAEHKARLIEGDKDLFGDGSLTFVSTPGHTPGHQSLLVHLEKTGYVVLSGDAVHFQSNWDNRRVPGFNYDKAQTLASMEKIARVLKEKGAQLWINHDKPSSEARRQAPGFFQ